MHDTKIYNYVPRDSDDTPSHPSLHLRETHVLWTCICIYFFDRQYSSESTQSMGYTLEEDLYSVNIYFPTNYFLINNIPRNPPNECNKSLIAWTLPPKMQNSLMGGGIPFKHVCNVCNRSLSLNPLNAKKKKKLHVGGGYLHIVCLMVSWLAKSQSSWQRYEES